MFTGFSNNICKLRLTVGCCEKIMANNSNPHTPVRSIMIASNAHTIRLRTRSTMAMPNVSNENMPRQTLGENRSDKLLSVCSMLCCFAVGLKSQNERFISLRFVPFVDTISARSKSLHRRSGRNCCCSNEVRLSAFTPRSKSLPNRAQRCSSL